MAEKKQEAYQRLDHINLWISNCDTKSSIILAFIGVFTPLLFTSAPVLDSIKYAMGKLSSHAVTIYEGTIFAVSSMLILAMTASLTYAIYYIIRALTATVSHVVFKEDGLITKSDLFFATIKSQTFKSYFRNASNKSDSALLKDIHSQIYINAHICTNKFAFYNRAITGLKCTLATLLLLSVVYIVSFLQKQ